ncbi:permease [Opitutus terrae PB90-1]|uniref:Permease n=2 Tax=Opitutus terrae TaxID=107709 RepID=B1ZX27_OPITP|nr:permease [Opitutus terrae PB90-1]
MLDRIRALLFRSRIDREMNEELRAHLERETEQNLARGLPPDEARYAALRAFGGVEQLKEREREARGGLWIDHTLRDLRMALRQLVKAPGFALAAVLILGIGIAGNTVVFSLVNGIYLRPIPFPQPEQLVDIDITAPKWNLVYTGINYDAFEAWRQENQTFAGMAHWRGGAFNLAIAGRSEHLPGQQVTHDLAEVFGVQPALGRMFRADEELRGGPKIALIGYHLWQEWFAGDPAVIGKTITVDSEPHEIIGVLPPTAVFPSRAAVWLPFAEKPNRQGWAGNAIGRLKPGVTVEQASADLLRIHRAHIPDAKEYEVTSPVVQPLLWRYLGRDRTIGVVLQGAVLVLLLIAGANIAGLVLARTLARLPELGLRAALGASRFQLLRQLLVESIVLAALGGAAGHLLGRWLLAGALRLFPDLPAWSRFDMDWRFAAFIIGLTALGVLVAGLIPARHVLSRVDVRSVMGPAAQQATHPASRLATLRILVVGEIALALLLLFVAGLLGRAFLRVQQINPGVQPERRLIYGLSLPSAAYRDNASRLAFFEQHLARLRALPDVEAASVSTILPFSGTHSGSFFEPEGGLPGGPDAKSPVILTRICMPEYFATIGITFAAGQGFTEQNWHYKIIVNETLAQLFWPGQNAVGKRMRSRGSNDPWLEVVGVARDVRHYGLEREVRPGVYVPFHAMPQAAAGVVVRTRGEPEALAPTVRTLLQEQDPSLPLMGISTLEKMIGQSLFLRRMYSGMTVLFALVAVAMAMAGLYGIVAYVVGQRTREFGIRLALGAPLRELLRLVLREGARLAAAGFGFGIPAGILAGFALSRLLYGIRPWDPLTIVAATLLLGLIVGCACLAPARRAARVNVIEVLRNE